MIKEGRDSMKAARKVTEKIDAEFEPARKRATRTKHKHKHKRKLSAAAVDRIYFVDKMSLIGTQLALTLKQRDANEHPGVGFVNLTVLQTLEIATLLSGLVPPVAAPTQVLPPPPPADDKVMALLQSAREASVVASQAVVSTFAALQRAAEAAGLPR